MKRHLALAALLLAFASAPATSASDPFLLCDGYAAPKGKSDGISQATWLYGLASATSDFRRASVTLLPSRVAMCDEALADPVLLPDYWLRRAHLLQSKALHQLAAGKPDEAARSLDESDAAGAGRDPLFEQSTGLGNLAIRAMVLFQTGRADEARAALDRLEAARPYSMTLRALSHQIRASHDTDRASRTALTKGTAVLNPRALTTLFWTATVHGEFAEAIAYGRQLTFEEPYKRGEWIEDDGDNRNYELMPQQIRARGGLAYALAATGDLPGALAELERGREVIARFMTPETTRSGRRKRDTLSNVQARSNRGAESLRLLDDWEKTVRLRGEPKRLTYEIIIAQMEAGGDAAIIAAPDLASLLKDIDPARAAEGAEAAQAYRLAFDQAQLKAETLNLNEIAALMPRPENEKMRPRMQLEGGNILRSDLNGYAVRDAASPGLFNIRFGSATASSAMVEEAGLLAAANHVVSLGKDAFVIEAAQIIQRTTHISGMYVAASSVPSGYEIRLLIRPLDSTATTGEIEPLRWRMLKAADVQARLAAKFPRAT